MSKLADAIHFVQRALYERQMSVSATHPVAAIHQDLMQRDVTRAALPELGATAAVPVLAELVHDPHDSTSRIERTAISQAVRAEPASTTNRTVLNTSAVLGARSIGTAKRPAPRTSPRSTMSS